jgi:hypothetical protein
MVGTLPVCRKPDLNPSAFFVFNPSNQRLLNNGPTSRIAIPVLNLLVEEIITLPSFGTWDRSDGKVGRLKMVLSAKSPA